MLFAVTSIASAITLTHWGSIWAIIAGIVALLLLFWGIVRWLLKKGSVRKIYACYLKPKRQYPNGLTFNDAPDKEEYPHKLTVNTGKYTLFIQIYSPIDIVVDPIRISFIGNEANKPRLVGKNNPFIRERLDNGYVRDWWGDMQPPGKTYPYSFYHQDCFMEANQIETFGKWQGKMLIEIPIREIGKIERYLDFVVSLNPNDDDVPYLKNFGTDGSNISSGFTTNISRPI